MDVLKNVSAHVEITQYFMHFSLKVCCNETNAESKTLNEFCTESSNQTYFWKNFKAAAAPSCRLLMCEINLVILHCIRGKLLNIIANKTSLKLFKGTFFKSKSCSSTESRPMVCEINLRQIHCIWIQLHIIFSFSFSFRRSLSHPLREG